MATTRTGRTLQSSTSNGAGSTTTGSAYTQGDFSIELIATITNGATGPTTGCYFIIEASTDGSTWREWFRGLAGTDNNGVYSFPIGIPDELMQIRPKFTGNTGQAVTVECLGHELTSR